MRIALFQPDMPPNVGAVIRIAACLDFGLDIIEPCGFPMNDKALRRAALDYGRLVAVRRHDGWSTYVADARRAGGRIVAVETTGTMLLEDFAFEPDDSLLFGRETEGLPQPVLGQCDASIRIALVPGARSLNLSVAAGIAAWAARLQGGVRRGGAGQGA